MINYCREFLLKCILFFLLFCLFEEPSWLYGSWIHNYLCNQCLSPLMLWVWIMLRRGVLDTTFRDVNRFWSSRRKLKSSCAICRAEQANIIKSSKKGSFILNNCWKYEKNSTKKRSFNNEIKCQERPRKQDFAPFIPELWP